jgi:hypothetical protein
MKNKLELINAIYEDAEAMEGFDDCIAGIMHSATEMPRICYDRRKVIDQLIRDHGMLPEEAREHFEYSLLGVYAGSGSPTFIQCF